MKCNKDEPGDGRLKMPRHHGRLNRRSKLPDGHAPLPRRTIQIHSLLKAKQIIKEIARLLGRHRSTFIRELPRGRVRPRRSGLPQGILTRSYQPQRSPCGLPRSSRMSIST